jgi:hypothetical protein
MRMVLPIADSARLVESAFGNIGVCGVGVEGMVAKRTSVLLAIHFFFALK